MTLAVLPPFSFLMRGVRKSTFFRPTSEEMDMAETMQRETALRVFNDLLVAGNGTLSTQRVPAKEGVGGRLCVAMITSFRPRRHFNDHGYLLESATSVLRDGSNSNFHFLVFNTDVRNAHSELGLE